jgi:hypothetical protein
MLVEVEGVVSSLSVVIASILFTSYQPWNGVRRNKSRAKFSFSF